jgi:acyl-CoA synthetase (AMP-forming)/AMP-acid ligase II
MTTRLAERLRAVLALDPRADMIEFDGEWWTWGRVAELATSVAARLPEIGAPVGILLRNTPAHVGALLGVLLADCCVVTINPSLGEERVRVDLAALDLDMLVGTDEDLARFSDGATQAPRLVLRNGGVVGGQAVRKGELRPGVSVLMLTSGTTGPPKRIELTAEVLVRTMEGAKHYESNAAIGPTLRSGVAIVNSPLVHLSGVFRSLQCVLDGRSFVLLRRFEVVTWAAAVRTYQPKTASLVPAALRMVLDSDLRADDLGSLLSVTSGTAPLDPADAEAFESRFGVSVLTSYAATEFGGGVAGWNLRDHRAYGAAKRGSVGRAHAGCGLRVVTDEGAELGADEVGLLEVKPAQFGPDAGWVRTTDLARIDADGFLWILGRADQTIIRGGFKVQPDTVRLVLEHLPPVRAASVFGIPDDRLGEIAVALVELRAGEDTTVEDLLEQAAPSLARYEVPAVLQIVAELPRTASGKVDLSAARVLVSTGSTSGASPTDDADERATK